MTLVVGLIVPIVAGATCVALVMLRRSGAIALIAHTGTSLVRLALCAAFCWLMLRAQQRIR